jgi:hypothetical protein
VVKNILIASTYGYASYRLREMDFACGATYKLGVTAFFGAKKNVLAKAFHTGVSRKPKNLSYFGVGLGYRIF